MDMGGNNDIQVCEMYGKCLFFTGKYLEAKQVFKKVIETRGM